jgi:hypothetical protein
MLDAMPHSGSNGDTSEGEVFCLKCRKPIEGPRCSCSCEDTVEVVEAIEIGEAIQPILAERRAAQALLRLSPEAFDALYVNNEARSISTALRCKNWSVVHEAARRAESLGFEPPELEGRIRSAAIRGEWSLIANEGPAAIPFLMALAEDSTIGQFYTDRVGRYGRMADVNFRDKAIETLGEFCYPEVAAYLEDRISARSKVDDRYYGPEIRAFEKILGKDPSCVSTEILHDISGIGRYRYYSFDSLRSEAWKDCSVFQNLVQRNLNRRPDRDSVRLRPGVERLNYYSRATAGDDPSSIKDGASGYLVDAGARSRPPQWK